MAPSGHQFISSINNLKEGMEAMEVVEAVER
jgi:hypothetical protein